MRWFRFGLFGQDNRSRDARQQTAATLAEAAAEYAAKFLDVPVPLSKPQAPVPMPGPTDVVLVL